MRQALPFLFLLPLMTGGCKPPPEQGREMALASPERGKAAIERVGCASCHSIAGIDWPKGKAGPPLRAMNGRSLIAGELPNRPEILAAFVRNAPALVRLQRSIYLMLKIAVAELKHHLLIRQRLPILA